LGAFLGVKWQMSVDLHHHLADVDLVKEEKQEQDGQHVLSPLA